MMTRTSLWRVRCKTLRKGVSTNRFCTRKINRQKGPCFTHTLLRCNWFELDLDLCSFWMLWKCLPYSGCFVKKGRGASVV